MSKMFECGQIQVVEKRNNEKLVHGTENKKQLAIAFDAVSHTSHEHPLVVEEGSAILKGRPRIFIGFPMVPGRKESTSVA